MIFGGATMSNLLYLFLSVSLALYPRSEPSTDSGLPIWFWVLVVLILIVLPILVVWFGPGLQKKAVAQSEESAGQEPQDHEPAPAAVEPEAAQEVPVEPDDLRRIEGIGPKIAGVLQEAGILTYGQLAETEVARLGEILSQDSRLSLANPSSWSEQAKLAAAGEWEALEALQDSLKGGRTA